MKFDIGDKVYCNLFDFTGKVLGYDQKDGDYLIERRNGGWEMDGVRLNHLKQTDHYILSNELSIGERYWWVKEKHLEFVAKGIEGLCLTCINECKENNKEQCPLFRRKKG